VIYESEVMQYSSRTSRILYLLVIAIDINNNGSGVISGKSSTVLASSQKLLQGRGGE